MLACITRGITARLIACAHTGINTGAGASTDTGITGTDTGIGAGTDTGAVACNWAGNTCIAG